MAYCPIKHMPSSEKIRIIKESDGITVRIKPPKYWPVLISIPLTLAGLTYGGIVGLNAISKGEDKNSYIVPLFLAFLGAIAALHILAFLWNVFGEEIISIRNGFFTRKLALGWFGIKKTVPTDELFNLRPSGFFDDSSRELDDRGRREFGLAGGTVAVDTKYETLYRFGIRLEASESVALAQALEPYLPYARYSVSVPLPDMR